MRVASVLLALSIPAGSATPPVSSPDELLPRSASAAPLLQLSFDAQAGYDDDLLADPQGAGVLEPVSTSLFVAGPVLRARRAGLFSRNRTDRCEAAVEAGMSGYAQGGVGPDRSFEAGLRYQTELSPRLSLEANAAFDRFRRQGLPIFDLDLPLAGVRLARTAGEHGLLAGELTYARLAYPGRALGTGRHQVDDRIEIAAVLLRSFGVTRYAALRAGWRRDDSNDSLAAYHGPVLEMRAGLGAVSRLKLAAAVAFGQRSYFDYPVLRSIGAGETRSDGTLYVTLAAERALTARARVYVQGLAVRQWSNVAELAFRQTRVVAGFHVALWKVGSEGGSAVGLPVPAAAPHPLTPQVLSQGVRFRVRAPGAARVALVGGFNGWHEERDLCRGPGPDGTWEITVALPAGTWRYSFVVDGKWVRPEGAPRYEEDGFGGANGVLDLETPAGEVPAAVAPAP